MTKNNLFQPIYLLFLKKWYFSIFLFLFIFLFNIYIILSFCHYKNKNVDIYDNNYSVDFIKGYEEAEKTFNSKIDEYKKEMI